MFLPQMSPMMWTLLMMMFTMTTVVTMSNTYFNYKKSMESKKKWDISNLKWLW